MPPSLLVFSGLFSVCSSHLCVFEITTTGATDLHNSSLACLVTDKK